MQDNAPYVSLYDQRITLVADALRQHPALSETDAVTLATHALHALDHIPEKLR